MVGVSSWVWFIRKANMATTATFVSSSSDAQVVVAKADHIFNAVKLFQDNNLEQLWIKSFDKFVQLNMAVLIIACSGSSIGEPVPEVLRRLPRLLETVFIPSNGSLSSFTKSAQELLSEVLPICKFLFLLLTVRN